MANNPGVTIEISGGGSGNGIKAIIDGTTDIGNASRFIKDSELNHALGRNIYPVPFRIAYDCIVPVVHPFNPVADLSIDELKQIYTGEARNWNKFSGKNHEIAVISRDTSSGTYEVWEKKIMDKAAIYPGAVLKPGNSEVVTEVSKNPYAIGYIGLGYYNSLVKMLSVVDGIKGQKTNAAIIRFEKENDLPIDLRLSESLITSLTDKYMEQAGHQE